jgi:hypothetical protein
MAARLEAAPFQNQIADVEFFRDLFRTCPYVVLS